MRTGFSKAPTSETGWSSRTETTTESGSVLLAKVFCFPVGIDRQKPSRNTLRARRAASRSPRFSTSMSRLTVA